MAEGSVQAQRVNGPLVVLLAIVVLFRNVPLPPHGHVAHLVPHDVVASLEWVPFISLDTRQRACVRLSAVAQQHVLAPVSLPMHGYVVL